MDSLRPPKLNMNSPQASVPESDITPKPEEPTPSAGMAKWVWWLIGGVAVLIIAAVIYTFVYIDNVKNEQREAELLAKEKEQAEQARLQAQRDSIEAVHAEQIRQEELDRNLSTPDLRFFGLKGRVRSFTTALDHAEYGMVDYLTAISLDRTLNFDSDGNLTGLENSLKSTGIAGPVIKRNANGGITSIVYGRSDSDDDAYNNYEYSWKGDDITSVNNQGWEWYGHETYTYSSGRVSSVKCRMGGEGVTQQGTITVAYTGFDSYGNWTRAEYSYSGYSIDETMEESSSVPESLKTAVTRTISYY